jgi:hypothetical protein
VEIRCRLGTGSDLGDTVLHSRLYQFGSFKPNHLSKHFDAATL